MSQQPPHGAFGVPPARYGTSASVPQPEHDPAADAVVAGAAAAGPGSAAPSAGLPPTGKLPVGNHPSGPAPGGRRPQLGRRAPQRAWIAWLLLALCLILAVALVLWLVLAPGSSDDPIAAPSGAPQTTASAAPTSTLPAAVPVRPAEGATIPITVDVAFEEGITFVLPEVGDWQQGSNERQPDALVLEDPRSGAYIEIVQTRPPTSTYRDEDLTRAFLIRADGSFAGDARLDGEPESLYVEGGAYRLELLAQRVSWPLDSSAALVLARVMPHSGAAIQAYVIANETQLDDPGSRVNQKLAELSFTVP